MISSLREFLLGTPINPLNPNVRKNVLLVALLAWVGLGADALSSACYGPEEAFLALGDHSNLAVFVSAITVLTVFIIAIGYNQVIELFPGGGGGYRVATRLLNPYVGLVSGCALLVDYVLTITVSTASGMDAVFSLLPLSWVRFKLFAEIFCLLTLLFLNMRGMKEAIKVLLPIFLGFMVLHLIVILYGIVANTTGITVVLPKVWQDTRLLAQSAGWFTVIGLTLHAYSLGSGTYTGLEAVSNNVQSLVEPRVKTGKRTMLYMALSLSFTAGGIILLYLLWGAKHQPGQTLNAVVFHSILGDGWVGRLTLILILQLEAALLLVAANTGFVAGPTVLANMAVDGWLPNRFRLLSNRLVTQNGLLLFGLASIAILALTEGEVSTLVVLYSINVFITFTLSLLGISVYWVKHRRSKKWIWNFLLSGFSCTVTGTVLVITLYFKFMAGGWVTLLLTSSIITICLFIKRHYIYIAKRLGRLEKELAPPLPQSDTVQLRVINPKEHTAVIFVNVLSVGMHTLLFIMGKFPEQFKNFIFLSAGAVDMENFHAEKELEKMQAEVKRQEDYFVRFCRQHGYSAEAYYKFGTDPITELEDLIDKVCTKYPNAIFFASQLIFIRDNVLTALLHNQTAFILQDYLNYLGKELIIVPMKL